MNSKDLFKGYEYFVNMNNKENINTTSDDGVEYVVNNTDEYRREFVVLNDEYIETYLICGFYKDDLMINLSVNDFNNNIKIYYNTNDERDKDFSKLKSMFRIV